MVINNIGKWLYRVYMYKLLLVNVSVSLIVSGVQPHMTITTPKLVEGGSIEVEGVEIEEEVKTFIKIDLPSVGGTRSMLAEKKPNIEFRTDPFTKNAGRIGGGHTQPIQTPPLLVILSRRKTRKGTH